MRPNGPALSFVRVSALFHCPPLNNFTKIKLSQQTTKPRMEFERVLYAVFYSPFSSFWIFFDNPATTKQ